MGKNHYGLIIGLPRTTKGFDSIWVIIDWMTKSAHFLPIKITFNASQYVQLHIDEIVKLHGVLMSIILDRGSQFTSQFWRAFQEALGTHLDLSTAFHL